MTGFVCALFLGYCVWSMFGLRRCSLNRQGHTVEPDVIPRQHLKISAVACYNSLKSVYKTLLAYVVIIWSDWLICLPYQNARRMKRAATLQASSAGHGASKNSTASLTQPQHMHGTLCMQLLHMTGCCPARASCTYPRPVSQHSSGVGQGHMPALLQQQLTRSNCFLAPRIATRTCRRAAPA